MLTRNPVGSASNTAIMAGSGFVRALSAKAPVRLAALGGFFARNSQNRATNSPELHRSVSTRRKLAGALRSWAGCAVARCDQASSNHRKRRGTPRISSQSAVDFAVALNTRLARNSRFTAYPALPLRTEHGPMFCRRHRKVLYAGLFMTFVLTAPASTREGGARHALAGTSAGFSALHPRSTLAQPADLRFVWVLKDGLREATALFGRFSATANARNVATMTAGIRN